MEQLLFNARMVAPATVPDEAMETFRTFSNFSPLSCHVAAHGKEMRYRIMRPNVPSDFERRCEVYLKHSRLVIAIFQLPLVPELDVFRIGDVVIEATLVLKYSPDRD